MQVAGRAEVSLANSAHIVILDMVPVLVAIILPVRASTVVATLTHRSTIFVATMVKQVIPRGTIVVTLRALVMVWGVSLVLV